MHRSAFLCSVIAVIGLLFASCASAAPPRLSVSGSQILSPSGAPFIPRGYDWNEYAQPTDARENRAQGANFVRFTLGWHIGRNSGCQGGYPGTKFDAYSTTAPGNVDPQLLAELDQKIAWAGAQGLWVDLAIRGGDCDFWTDPSIQQRYIVMWTFLANRYRNTPYIGMWELLSEPHPTGARTDNGPVRALFERAITAIRAVDPVTPIVVGPAGSYNIRNLDQIILRNQRNIIYTANFFELTDYVKQTKNGGAATGGYPGRYADAKAAGSSCNYPGKGSEVVTMDHAFLAGLFQCAINFRRNFNVPVFIDQIGVRSGVPDSLRWTSDMLDLFNANNIGWAYWDYRSEFTGRGKSLQANDIGVTWQDATGQWRQKSDWIAMLSAHMKR
jgi:hypothetical protein